MRQRTRTHIAQTPLLAALCILVQLLGPPPEVFAADSLHVDNLIRAGQAFAVRQQFDSAALYLEIAGRLCEKDGNTEKVLYCRNRIAYNYLQQARYREADLELRKADSVLLTIDGQRNPETVQTYYLRGYLAICLDSADSAARWLRKALSLTGSLRDQHDIVVANCYYMLAVAFQRKGVIDSALTYAHRDLEACLQDENSHPLETALAFTVLGDLKRTIRDVDTAIICLSEAHRILQRTGLGETNHSCSVSLRLATAYLEDGDLPAAVTYADSAVSIARRLYGDDHVLTAAAYATLGDACSDLGDWSRAGGCLELALKASERHYGHWHSVVAGLYAVQAKNYLRQDSLNKASGSIAEAIAIEGKIFPGHRPSLGRMYQTQGLISQKQGDHRKALISFSRSAEVFRHLDTPIPAQLGELDIESASSYLAVGLTDSARGRLDSALSVFGPAVAAVRRQRSRVYRMLGELDERTGDTLGALGCYDQAVSVARGEKKQGKEDDVVYLRELIDAGLRKARLLESCAEMPGDARKRDPVLISLCREMITVIETARQDLREEDSKLAFSNQTLPFCEIGIDACLRGGGRDQIGDFQDTAFAFAEYGKARVLLESLDREAALRVAGVSAAAATRERKLLSDIASLDVRIQRAMSGSEKQDKPSLEQLQAKRLAVFQDLSHFEDSLLSALPAVEALLKAPERPSLRSIQSILPDDACLVEYFHGNLSIYAFLIRPRRVKVVRLGAPGGLEKLVATYLEGIRTVDPAKYISSANALYKKLVSPLDPYLRGTRRLILVPEWSFAAIPFEAFLEHPVQPAAGEEIDFTRLPYLVKHFDISYAYSASFLLRTRKDDGRPPREDDFIGFAPAFPERRQGLGAIAPPLASLSQESRSSSSRELPELANASDEVRSIAGTFKHFGRTADIFLGRSATEREFKHASPSYTYVHVATHGILDPVAPRFSALLFADSRGALDREDGLLYGEEAYNLHLNAKLVTLSSCESGTGKAVKGEGLLALTRGFFYAGAANVLSSLWKVSDASTRDLMVDFYRNVLRGTDLSRSVRRAKLDLIAAPSTAYPREWAGFILIGS